METLIEIYDERAIENVIGPETLRPKRVIYLCPQEVAEDMVLQAKLRDYFAFRGIEIDVRFVASSRFDTDKIVKQLRRIVDKYRDCALDVTGGSDAGLVAAGIFCNEYRIPTFTYSRKRNRFYDISGAAFVEAVSCNLEYTVEDFFRMAGGTLRKGRVDNSQMDRYMEFFDPFFKVFLKYRRKWVEAITFFQRISQVTKGEVIPLTVTGNYEQKGERGSRIFANESLLRDLEEIGFLTDVTILEDKEVTFTFRDEQIRAWLRDVGSVLELYVYKACRDTGIFSDVISSAIVDWDGTVGHDSVSNEIDVVASRGIVPIFISCKACEVKTEALNELAILRDRFGGKSARSVIVTTENCNAAARHRAAQLHIAVIDLEELENGSVAERLKVIMKYSEMPLYK